MGRKTTKLEEMGNNDEVVNALVETKEQVASATLQPTIKNGYIRIKQKGKEGRGVVVHVKMWGNQYKDNEWEILEEFKKK